MRIIRGTWKSRRITPPQSLPVRPTTDMAKEALFNVLENIRDIETLRVLDLFSGTGNISYEFASRGAPQITAVEQNFRCAEFIRKTIESLKMNQIHLLRADVFTFLKKTQSPFDLIFADPPYDNSQLDTIPDLVFEHHLLFDGGLLIMEHPIEYNFKNHPHFQQQRHYGKVNFSFFE